ncbi:MAG TPA: FkbM family methyltransferase [Verrucomicrobiae bacterium]|nr:FkbM family methyltransferase [Verrucomicrobiae bacterium]
MYPDFQSARLPSAAGSWHRLLRRAARRLLPVHVLTKRGVSSLLGIGSSHGHVVDNVDGLQMEYSLDSLIGQLLFLRGEFEKSEAAFIKRRLQHVIDAVVIDVGANIGLHSLQAARLASVRQVFAFEPAHTTFAMLERNITRNGFAEKIHAYPLAVSKQPGRAEFHFCADDAYSSLTLDGRRPVQQTYEVAVVNLDGWSKEVALDRVDFVKIDVEGSELDVIQGAEQMLARHRPELMVEVFQGSRHHFSAVDLIERIRSLGYDAYVLIEGVPVPFERHDDRHFNYHFVPSR